jgi:hypothetical protein
MIRYGYSPYLMLEEKKDVAPEKTGAVLSSATREFLSAQARRSFPM